MINFRYNILHTLGSGGSGEVFLAEDTLRENQHVALKVLHSAEKTGSESVEAFRNEVSALLSLTHPNLIHIFDFGIIRESDATALRHRQFFTMELIRGMDALEWSQTVSNQKEREKSLELLFLQALSVLSYVHRERIIHFDIKPQNLVLLGEQRPNATPLLKLTDFGFSRQQDETAGIQVRGTLEYTAPEMLRGQPCDHRADLYSLGATFFQLVEGRCPFESPEPVDLVKRALTEEPVFLFPESAGGARLRRTIRRLLQKDPEQRFHDAEEAARFFVEGTPNGGELLESYFGLSKQPNFVGRESEREHLESALSSIAAREGSPVVAFIISGEEGIGKTSLLGRAMRFARALDVSVFETGNIQNEVPFASIIRTLQLLASEVQSFSPEGKNLFARHREALGLDRGGDILQRWAKEKEKYIELIARFVLESAGMFPFILVADNAHFLDEQSAAALRTIVRDAGNRDILLLAAETAGPRHFLDAAAVSVLNLRELSESEVTEMSASVFGPRGISADIGAKVYQLYGGTPGIVVEALHAISSRLPKGALDNGTLAKEFVSTLEAQLPRDIDDFILDRFRKLGRERQLILSILSCFQNPASGDLLLNIFPFHRQRSTDQLRYLQLDGFVGTLESNRLFMIRIKRLKDAIYASIQEEHHDLHALVAAALETFPGENSFTQLQELGFQFAKAGNATKAMLYFEKAGDEGLRLFAFQRSLQLYDEAIALATSTGETAQEFSLKTKYVTALFKAGSYQESIALGKKLVERQDIPLERRISLSRAIGLSLSRLGETEPAQEYISVVLHLSADEAERVELEQELVGLEISSGRFLEAEAKCRQQLEHAKQLKNDSLVGAIYTDLGIATFFQDRFDLAAECFAEALKQYEALHEKTQVTNSMNNIGNALSAKGDFVRAVSIWERALKASQESGTLMQQAQIQNNLGIAHYNLRQYQKAKIFYGEARAMYQHINSRLGLASTLHNLGEVTFAEGEYEAALEQWREGKKLFQEIDNAPLLTESCLHLANVLGRIGDIEAMGVQLDDAERMILERKLDTFTARYKFLRGMHALAGNDFARAGGLFSEAEKLCRNDRSKEMFLTCLLRLAEARHMQGESLEALALANEVLANPDVTRSPTIAAEANYLIGLIAIARPELVPEKAIVYFKHGIEIVAKEPVGETTWKLTFALAREYFERGQRDRAKEFLVKTKLVVQFFLSHFHSPELKKLYLSVDQKQNVLATIEAITKQ